jgi:membrane protease subunit HflK
MYTDALQQIYGNVTKVLVDSKQGSNLLYLPLDKIIQQASQAAASPAPAADANAPAVLGGNAANTMTPDPRSRDAQRSRDRDAR